MPPFELLDTLSNQQRKFVPLEAGKVKMYACGVTVYDMSHIGHARTYIVWDTLRRYLTYLGYEVIYVQNYTDIDDKIIAKANASGKHIDEITADFIAEYEQDMNSLNILPPVIQPKATGYIPQMLDMVAGLEDTNHAYNVDGDVLFDTSSFPDYLKLSKRKMDDALSGEGLVNKKHPADFSLWKKSKPGEPFWESKWGNGRPGWHLECSAMIKATLGDTIDIHCGGADLVFPHHENEIAQSEAISKKPLANFWLHNGFVNIDNEKMSKSLKNFITIREIVTQYHPMALRFFVLSSHYRTPLDFSYEALDGAWAGLKNMARGLQSLSPEPLSEFIEKEVPPEILFFRKTIRDSVEAAMSKDFNTPATLAVVFKSIDEAKKLIRKNPDGGKYYRYFIENVTENVLGIDIRSVEAALPQVHIVDGDGTYTDEIEVAVQTRLKAKTEKNFALADQLRSELQSKYNITMEDGKDFIRWFKN